jgi:hypothetical protein
MTWSSIASAVRLRVTTWRTDKNGVGANAKGAEASATAGARRNVECALMGSLDRLGGCADSLERLTTHNALNI